MEVAGKTEETDHGELWREREEREGGRETGWQKIGSTYNFGLLSYLT